MALGVAGGKASGSKGADDKTPPPFLSTMTEFGSEIAATIGECVSDESRESRA